MRITSLSPAITETLSLLGLEDEIVGVTPWCKMYLRDKLKPIAGTYTDVNIEVLKNLKPDVVFLQAHVHDHVFPVLKDKGFNVYLVPLPTNVLDIISNVEFIAIVVERYWEGKKVADDLLNVVLEVKRGSVSIERRPRVYVEFLWPDRSVSTCGALTYVDDGVRVAGGRNIFSGKLAKFFSPKDEEILYLDPEVVFVNIEPQFKGMTVDEYVEIRCILRSTKAYKNSSIHLIVESPEANLAHPGPSFISSTLKKLSEKMSIYPQSE